MFVNRDFAVLPNEGTHTLGGWGGKESMCVNTNPLLDLDVGA